MTDASARNLDLEARALLDLDEDAQRVYADWLQSRGDPRGELISLELHHRQAYRLEKQAIAAEIAAREASYREQWQAWASERGLGRSKVKLRKGFVIDLRAGLSELVMPLTELLEREPIQRLTLTEADAPDLVELCRVHASALGRLRYLKVQGELGTEGAAALASVPFDRLEGLNLIATDLDGEAGPELAALRAPRLTSLALSGNEIDDEGLAALLRNPGRSHWRLLYLGGTPLTRRGLEALASDAELRALEGLYLKQIDAKFADFEALLAPGALPACELVELSAWGSSRQRELLARLRERFAKLRLL